MEPMIRALGVGKSFGGIHAVEDCSLRVAKGSITGLIGPNGAGKSTLFNIIAGIYRPSHGTIELDGRDVTGWPSHALFHAGLSRTFQIAQEFSRMTVIENLMAVPAGQIGENLARSWFDWRSVRAQEREIRDRAMIVLGQLRLVALATERAANLSGGQKKLLELGRTMMATPKIVLLDELGAGVNRALLSELAEEIVRLNREAGYTFFVIEHDMDLIGRLCDPVIVMAEGRVLTEGTMAEIRRDERVIEAYLGRRATRAATIPSEAT